MTDAEMNRAWMTLDDDHLHKVWDSFYETFKFNPSIHPENFPGIQEPTPSVTYSISRDFGDEETNIDLKGKLLAGLRSQVAADEWVYVLDWQHPCYWFYPHREFTDWFVPALPNGDYYIFLAEDFRFGIFGHPWEWTSCVWGSGLIEYFDSNTPQRWLSKIREKSEH